MKKHLSILLALVVSLAALSGCGAPKEDAEGENKPADNQAQTGDNKNTEPAEEDTTPAISSNSVIIDGKEYALPVAVEDLLNDGWTIAEDKLSNEYEPGTKDEGGSLAIKKSDTDKFFVRTVYNDSQETKTLKDCKISGIMVTFSVAKDLKLEFACGLNETSTYDDVIKAFGDPEGNENFSNGRKEEKKSLQYDNQNESHIDYRFNFEENGDPSSFTFDLKVD